MVINNKVYIKVPRDVRLLYSPKLLQETTFIDFEKKYISTDSKADSVWNFLTLAKEKPYCL